MKKATKARLIRNIVLLLLPIIAYYGVFIAFEPNNYFGLKAKADGTNIMAELRQYQKQPANRIILGDSRIAKFSPENIRTITGEDYANLAYGGASVKEQLDILDWAMQQNENLTEVVFMLSFYTINEAYSHDRMVVRALNNPFVYLTNLGYNINMLTNLQNHLTGQEIGGEGETMDPSSYEYTDFTDPVTGEVHHIRTKMATHIADLSGRMKNWKVNDKVLNRLVEAIDECTEQGIRVVVVLPPTSADVQQLVIGSYGIAPQMAPVLKQLRATKATVLDYEFELTASLTDDQFYDGFHLDLQSGLPVFEKLLFTAIAQGDGHAT